MAQVTIDAKGAADALGISSFYLANYLRDATADSLTRLAGYIRRTERELYDLADFDEAVLESRRLLAAANACRVAYTAEIAG